ncbi:hypothetical protein [uncultured Pedobacter sp.]|uniref:hypothetical protein n=1 Tax=uncultured Pedobacter sp. TaxID=246139 RepID=UPI0025DD5E94|nr:hypothetical protein [uncultured Pedobacter sp.]
MISNFDIDGEYCLYNNLHAVVPVRVIKNQKFIQFLAPDKPLYISKEEDDVKASA